MFSDLRNRFNKLVVSEEEIGSGAVTMVINGKRTTAALSGKLKYGSMVSKQFS